MMKTWSRWKPSTIKQYQKQTVAMGGGNKVRTKKSYNRAGSPNTNSQDQYIKPMIEEEYKHVFDLATQLNNVEKIKVKMERKISKITLSGKKMENLTK